MWFAGKKIKSASSPLTGLSKFCQQVEEYPHDTLINVISLSNVKKCDVNKVFNTW